MRMRSKVGITIPIIVVTAVVVELFATRSRPVVYALTEAGDPVHEPVWSLLNPFRDRSPERAAEIVLQHFRRGEYEEAAGQIDQPTERRAQIVREEKDHPLLSWKLVDRTDTIGTTKLFYRRAWGKSSSLDAPLWISLRRSGREWKVATFEGWY